MEQKKRTKKELMDCRMLREVWHKSGPYWEAMRRVKIQPNQYRCEKCGKVFPLRDMQIDHKEPCVEVEKGWISLQVFAYRLFCSPDKLQVLCYECHAGKTKKENKERHK